MSNTTRNRVALFILFCIFEGLLVIIEQTKPDFHLDPFTWVLIVVAASLGGPAIAYLAIGEWIRWPLTKVVPHSSGAGEDVEPKYEGFRRAPGILMSCPICSATWVGLVLIGLYALYEPLGRYVTYTLSVGGAAAFIVRTREAIEAGKYALTELNGKLNRENKQAQAQAGRKSLTDLDYAEMELRFLADNQRRKTFEDLYNGNGATQKVKAHMEGM